jgi:hypothetical protein
MNSINHFESGETLPRRTEWRLIERLAHPFECVFFSLLNAITAYEVDLHLIDLTQGRRDKCRQRKVE